MRVYAKVGNRVIVFAKDMTFSESQEIPAALGQLGMTMDSAFEGVDAITIKGGKRINGT